MPWGKESMRNALIVLFTLFAAHVQAATVSGMYYATGSSLSVVDFDGTEFTSGGTFLEPLLPDWTAMSYDAAAGKMYYATGSSLNVVDFDGTEFTSGGTFLEPLLPDWTAMSLIFSDDDLPPATVPLPAGLWLMIGGLGALGVAGRRRAHRASE